MQDNVPADTAADKQPLDYYGGLNPLLFDMVPAHCSRFLEVGCAKGKLGSAIKKRNAGSYYVGIELFEDAGKEAAGLLDKVFISDIEAFDWTRLAGEQFDCIIFADVLEHLVNPGNVLRAAAAHLAPQGSVICCLPNVSHWSIIANLIRGEFEYADNGLMDRTHLRFFTSQSFKNLLKTCGFEVVTESRWFSEIPMDDAVLPLLRTMDVDPRGFMKRINTLQFVVHAQKIGKIPTRAPTKAQTGEGTTVPKQTIAVIACVSDILHLTDEFLDSLSEARSKSYAPQVIIMDDASTDGTADRLAAAARKFSWLNPVRNEIAVGTAKARNRAAGMTDAEILVFMDANSALRKGDLEKMLARINDKRVGMVGPKILYPDGSISQAGIVFTPDANAIYLHRSANPKDANTNVPKELPAITGACMMIRQDVFQELGGFSVDDPVFYSDLDLCFKVRRKGLMIVYQPDSQVVHPRTGNATAFPLTEDQNRVARSFFIGKWKDLMLKELQSEPSFYLSGRDFNPAGN